ncbi:MAG: hypothetical protein U0X58_00740 [Flavobacteriaceae bacterium]
MKDEAKHTWDKVNSWAEELGFAFKASSPKPRWLKPEKWGGEVYTHNGKKYNRYWCFKNYCTLGFLMVYF